MRSPGFRLMCARLIQFTLAALTFTFCGCGFEGTVETYEVESEQYSTTEDFVREFALPKFETLLEERKRWKLCVVLENIWFGQNSIHLRYP